MKDKGLKLKYLVAAVMVAVSLAILFFIRPQKIIAPAREPEARIAEPVDNTETPAENINYQYSRVTFFNAQPVRASLAIPGHWEGLYRLKEQGNVVFFYYIGDNKEQNLMSFILVKEGSESVLNVNSLLADKKGGYQVYYRTYEDNIAINSENKTKKLMYNDVIKVVDSLKLR